MDWYAPVAFGVTRLEAFAWLSAVLGMLLLARHVWLARRGRERWKR